MAIVGALVGGIIGTAVVGGAVSYSDHSDSYDDYSNYSDYSDYSDQAERERKRREEREEQKRYAQSELDQYKNTDMARFLQSNGLPKNATKSVFNLLAEQKNDKIRIKNETLEEEIQEIDDLISIIDQIIDDNK